MNDFDQLVESTILQITPDNFAKTLTIELRSADKSCLYVLRVDGVYDLLIDGVRLNNIVDEVLCYPESMSEAELLSKLQLLMTADSGSYTTGRFPHVDSKAEEIRGGDMRLWEFRPVYGASLLILARSLSLARQPG
jgi:hypothetical protein